MATAVCGCECQREYEDAWRIVDAAEDCPFQHRIGQVGLEQGQALSVGDIGECVTIVFERTSRTAMLITQRDGR
jgi:hypothetical protein